MKSIIEKLQWLSSEEGLSDALQSRLNAMEPYLAQIQAAFGLDFVDKLLDADSARLSAELDEAYQRGFGDAFQLWLEVFSRYSSYPQR